jgi:hypothetical protein
MKTINTLLLAGAVAVSFTFASSARADEAFLSPRAKANQIKRVSGVNTDRNLATGWYAGAAYKAFNTPHSMVASGAVPDVNLAGANYLGAAAKSPHRDLRGVEFQIAPLIENRNASPK